MPKNKEELKLKFEICDEIPLDFCKKLVMSIPKRISECITNRGGPYKLDCNLQVKKRFFL